METAVSPRNHVDDNQTYRRHERLIRTVASSFWRRCPYPGRTTFDDLLADANLFYCVAVRTHDSAKGPLPKRIAYHVWYGLMDQRTKALRREGLLPREQHDFDRDNHNESFNIDDFAANLSRDAKLVCRLTIALFRNTPKVAQRRQAVTEYLRNMGWVEPRIEAVFSELSKALQPE